MPKVKLRFLLLLGLCLFFFASPAWAAPPEVVVLRVKGTVNPALARYVERGIDAAEAHKASLIVIQLDTPGGLDEAMRDIIQRILNSSVPVAVYVSPAGARAASAGTFITIAAHVAAMAPGTSIGAAHPVALGQEGEQKTTSTMETKVLNDAASYIKSLAVLRQRNVEWAEKAVRESASVPAEEARTMGIVDLVAADLPTLLQELHGRRVRLLIGEATLNTKEARVTYSDMSLMEDFLFTISNPNIAFILLSLAMLALFFELANPGAVLPGVIGGILLLTALYSLGTLPVNWAGLLLIALAFIMFAAEVFVTSHGALAIGGVLAMVFGGMLLMSSQAQPNLQVDRRLIAGVAIALLLYFAFVIRAIVQSRRRPPSVGYEDLLGKTAIAKTPLDPEGLVFLNGELWKAKSTDASIAVAAEVVVQGAEGLRLKVTRKERR